MELNHSQMRCHPLLFKRSGWLYLQWWRWDAPFYSTINLNNNGKQWWGGQL